MYLAESICNNQRKASMLWVITYNWSGRPMYESTFVDQPGAIIIDITTYESLFRLSSAMLACPDFSRSYRILDLHSPPTSVTDRVSMKPKQIASCIISRTANRKITSNKVNRYPRDEVRTTYLWLQQTTFEKYKSLMPVLMDEFS